MSSQRYPEEFRIEAVRQITEHGHTVADVSRRLGVSTHSLYKWLQMHQMPAAMLGQQQSKAEELRRLKTDAKGFCRSKGLRLKSACVARLFKRPVSRTGWQRTRLCLVGSTALF